jgi:hypothetical protein
VRSWRNARSDRRCRRGWRLSADREQLALSIQEVLLEVGEIERQRLFACGLQLERAPRVPHHQDDDVVDLVELVLCSAHVRYPVPGGGRYRALTDSCRLAYDPPPRPCSPVTTSDEGSNLAPRS